MRPLRIHFFVNSEHPQGTYFRFHNLAVGLTQLGQQVEIFACDHRSGSLCRKEVRDGVTYHVVPESKGLSYIPVGNHPLTTLKRSLGRPRGCDIAHLFQPFSGAVGAWLRSKSQAKFFDWDDLWHGGMIEDNPKKLRDIYGRFVMGKMESILPKRADHVTTCSHFLADLATQRQARKASILVNGFWAFERPTKELAREKLGLKPNSPYVGFMGRTVLELPWCFDALAHCVKSHPELRFTLCGAEAAVLADVPAVVLDHVDNLGQLTPLQTRDFAAALDLGLLPLEDNAFNRSRFPIKFAEYMAAGAPVLCSQIGECAILSQEMEWVIKAGRSREEWLEAFLGAVNLMVSNQMPQVHVEQVKETFSWERLSANLLAIYRTELGHA